MAHRISLQKLIDGGGEKDNYGFNVKGGKTKNVGNGEAYKQDQGKVRGKTKHTYGVNGENDAD